MSVRVIRILTLAVIAGVALALAIWAWIPAKPEYFMLRPDVEKQYGYTHAVRVGKHLSISGAVSMDDKGVPTALNDMNQQMKNVYGDLESILDHYGYSFEDVTVENVYTTDMDGFLAVSEYRKSIYGERFPTGTWVQVESLALPGFLIEIELEAYRR